MSLVVHPFEIVAHPVRRRMLEVLAVGEHSAGTLADIAATEFGTSWTTASSHLRTLREHGAVWSSVGADEPRSRSYRLNPEFLASLDVAVGSLSTSPWDRSSSSGSSGTAPRKSARRCRRFRSTECTASATASGAAALPRSRSGCRRRRTTATRRR